MKIKSSLRQSKHALGRTQISVGVAFYPEPERLKIKVSAVDRDKFLKFHAEWEAMAEGRLIQLREAGFAPVKIPAQAEELFAFCEVEKVKNDGYVRAAFAGKRKEEIHRLGGGKGCVS